MSEGQDVVAARGTAPKGDVWAVVYAPVGLGGRHHLALLVNGDERESGSGFDIPGTTEIGFGGGLTPGAGHFYLYGLTSSRIRRVVAESGGGGTDSDVATEPLPAATTDDGSVLRVFVLVRPPVDDVTALVGLDGEGPEVQRIRLVGECAALAVSHA